ncbi:hypothetical protein Q7P37_002938 [Cladosporium fusiforme]
MYGPSGPAISFLHPHVGSTQRRHKLFGPALDLQLCVPFVVRSPSRTITLRSSIVRHSLLTTYQYPTATIVPSYSSCHHRKAAARSRPSNGAIHRRRHCPPTLHSLKPLSHSRVCLTTNARSLTTALHRTAFAGTHPSTPSAPAPIRRSTQPVFARCLLLARHCLFFLHPQPDHRRHSLSIIQRHPLLYIPTQAPLCNLSFPCPSKPTGPLSLQPRLPLPRSLPQNRPPRNTGYMPKAAFKNVFARRRSAGNILDQGSPSDSPEPAPSSSFKVIERADRTSTHNFDGADRKLNSPAKSSHPRPFTSPLQQLRGKSAENVLSAQNRYVLSHNGQLKDPRLMNQRGSRGTTNSGSSGYYDSSGASARYSSTSTLPSSLEPEHEPEEEELFPVKRGTAPMFSSAGSAAAPHPLPQPPSFTSRASRALSFGLKGKAPPPRLDDVPPLPPQTAGDRTSRDRAMTTSSYASTAVPQKAESSLDLPTADFGNDFGGMFDTFNNRRPSRGSPTPPAHLGGFHHAESQPMYPPRSYSRQGALPSPNELNNIRANTTSPYSQEGRRSNDGLVSSNSFGSPTAEDGPGLPAIAPAFLGGSKQGYAPVEQAASPNLERLSFESHNSQREFMTGINKENEPAYSNRQTHLDDGDRWSKKPDAKSTLPSASTYTATSSTARQPLTQAGSATSKFYGVSPRKSQTSDWTSDSRNSTPKAARFENQSQEESLFGDASPIGPPSRAVRHNANQTGSSSTPKKMTKAEFEALQKNSSSSAEQSEDEHVSGDEYDDEDEEERAKQATKQRRKQEANMSVYRQQMKKVTGGGPADLPSRPGVERNSQSASGLYMGGMNGAPPPDSIRGKQSDDDDEDVPLGILQAHGFPSNSRPPTRLGEDQSQRASVAGSVVGGGAGAGNLPAFARRLPVDPYYGAGLVNHANRESLAFNGGGSVYGAPASPMGHPGAMGGGGHPGGLVGVIAGEERAKAARRATPSNSYASAPLPTNMPMPRTMSMGNLAPPSMYPQGMPPMPGMPQMPQMPMAMPGQDPNQQMQQFMQMQMQFMQNMMAMQQASMGPQPGQQQAANNFNPAQGRPMSIMSQAPPNQGRSMTMMGPPPTWGQQAPQQAGRPASTLQPYTPSVHNMPSGPGASYTPSIAPSERSNIGMPSRYRPVSTMGGDANSNSAMMSGARSQSMTSSLTLQAFQTPASPQPQQPEQSQKHTIRIIDKPKGAPRISSRAVDPEEDEDQAWGEMAKKRSERKWKWGRSKKDKEESQQQQPLGELYHNVE